MKFFDFLFKRQAPTASEVAKGRLKVVLVQDRVKLTPETLIKIREELVAVLSKYVEIDEQAVEINLTQHQRADKLIADIPIKRQGLNLNDEPELHMLRPATATLSTSSGSSTAPNDERPTRWSKSSNKGPRRRR